MWWLYALIIGVVGSMPLLFRGRFTAFGIMAAVSTLVLGIGFYLTNPSYVSPLFGWYGFMVVGLWAVSAMIDTGVNYEFRTDGVSWIAAFPIIGGVIFLVVSISGSPLFRAKDYVDLIGNVETKVWTQDVQPKDPRHVRQVPAENASYLADKQLGQAGSAIGSQFTVANEYQTLQQIGANLWYVTPLDFRNFWTWMATGKAPGYIMVNAEDPKAEVIVKTDEKFVYMPGAFFGEDLNRYLWTHGYAGYGLEDYSFELDDQLHPFWVVSVTKPTIGFGGHVVLGVVTVNPTDGDIAFYKKGEVPTWIDRVLPAHLVNTNVNSWSHLQGGFWNTVFAKRNILVPESTSLTYGSNGDCVFVTALTSTNSDKSMVEIVYTDSRTGVSTCYKSSGGTELAIVEAVDNKVKFQHYHGSSPVLYNMFGVMTAIVPVLGENHTWQGVAYVDVKNLSVVWDDDATDAYMAYQEMVRESGHQAVPDLAHEAQQATVVIDRFAAVTRNGRTEYFLTVAGHPHVYYGGVNLSVELPLSRAGDRVTLRYNDSEQDEIPLLAFDNASIRLSASADQSEVRQRVAQQYAARDTAATAQTDLERLKSLSPEQLHQLLHGKK